MTRFLVAIASFMLASCATQLSPTPPAGTSAEVAAPQLRPGSSWRYAVSDGFTRLPRGNVEYRVRAVEGDTVTVDVVSGTRETTELYTRDGNWLRRPATNMQEFSYKPAYRALDFPLAAGKTWKARAMATDPATGKSFPVVIEGRVLGWEHVRVPAGEFDALKVRRLVYLDYFAPGDRGQSAIRETDWYAPGLNQVVRRETISQYLRLAADERPLRLAESERAGFIRVDDDHSDGGGVPHYVQDEWLVYELVAHSAR